MFAVSDTESLTKTINNVAASISPVYLIATREGIKFTNITNVGADSDTDKPSNSRFTIRQYFDTREPASEFLFWDLKQNLSKLILGVDGRLFPGEVAFVLKKNAIHLIQPGNLVVIHTKSTNLIETAYSDISPTRRKTFFTATGFAASR